MKKMRGLCPEFVKDILSMTERVGHSDKEQLLTYRQSWLAWLNRAPNLKVHGLEKRASFFVHGIHEAILTQAAAKQDEMFYTFHSDYVFYKHLLAGRNHREIDSFGQLKKGGILLLSYPNITGFSLEEVIAECKKAECRIFLDCAYFGTVRSNFLDLEDDIFLCIAFSLSKAFDLGSFRVGILFTNEAAPSLRLAQDENNLYYNTDTVNLGIQILDHTSPDILPELFKPYQTMICDETGLIALDPWFAAKTDDAAWVQRSRDKFPPYRICITDMVLAKYEEDKKKGYFGTIYEQIKRGNAK